MLQLNEQERRVFELLADGSEGAVLVGYLKRLVTQLTDTRTIGSSGDVTVEVRAANRAADIIEESLIETLSRIQHHAAESEQHD